MTAAERSIQTAVVYGIPAFVFALSTWRATTVFDEVIDLRWRRWRTEWETTLLELASQPAPGPELAASRVRERHDSVDLTPLDSTPLAAAST